MEISILLAKQIVIQLSMIFVGTIIKKIKLIDDGGVTALSKLVLYLILPCSIFNSFQIELKKDTLLWLFIATIVSILINILFSLVVMFLKKFMYLDGVEHASLLYPNCSNLIIPLVSATLGKDWLIYCCPYIFVQNILFFTVGISTIREEKTIDLKKAFININIVVIVVGLIFLVFHIPIPSMVGSVIDSFAAMIAPASMLVIGMSIGNSNIKKIFGNIRYFILCVIRLVFLPVMVILIIKFTGICTYYHGLKDVLLIVLMGASSSIAALVVQTARCYEKDSEKAGILNMLSVILLVITMPVIVNIYEKII